MFKTSNSNTGTTTLLFLAALLTCDPFVFATERPRLAVLTDIGGDPDDQQSLIRYSRVYDINDQDGIADWMRTEFPGMFNFMASKPEGRDRRDGVYRGMYLTGDVSTTSRKWIDEDIRSPGSLGSIYPVKTWTDPDPPPV